MVAGGAHIGAPIEQGTPELSEYSAAGGAGGPEAQSAAWLTLAKLKHAAIEINPAIARKLWRPSLAISMDLFISSKP